MIASLALLSLLGAAPAPAFAPKSRPYDAQHYKLEVKLLDDGKFKNKLTATLKAVKALTEIELDAYDLTVEMALVDGDAADIKLKYDPATKSGTMTLKPKKPVAPGKDATVEITYTGNVARSNEGFFTTSDPDDPAALPGYYTHFEPFYAQRFFPCNDQPADKATSEILAVVDGRYMVVSNGRKEKDEKFTEDGKNLRRVHWKQDKPHSTYLVAMAIAQLEPVLVTDDVPATIWVQPGAKERAFVAQDVLKGLYNFQVGYVGTKYPWAKLDVVSVPRFFWGGMENTSAIFERSSLLLVDHKNDMTARSRIVALLAHEMAHQYFGDYVTNAWWDEVWLNEGFATYLGGLTWDDYNDNDEFEVTRTVRNLDGYFVQEDGPHSHALVAKSSNPEDFFDATSYGKGAQVLGMLDLWIGKAEMKKVLKAYLEKHGGGPVTSNDFFKVVFDTTKKEKELKPFKESWLNKKGYPIIFPETSFGGGKLTVTIRQQPNHASEKGPFVFKLPIVIHRQTEPAYTKEETILVDKPEVKVTIDVPAAPQWINWNKGFGALAKVNTSSVSEDQWVDAARNDPDPSWRVVASRVLMGDMGGRKVVKEELKPTDAAMGALLDVLTKDASSYVREAVLGKLAETRFKQLPKEFAAPLFALAKRPEGLNEDPAGYIRVRRAAMEALGRVDNADGHKYLLDELGKRDIDINYLQGYAMGAARLGTTPALATLRAALVTQKGRGFGYYRRTVQALPLVTSVDVVTIMREVLKANAGNNEIARAIFDDVASNRDLVETQDYADLVRDIVLDEKTFGEELRFDVLGTLDDVKYESAKQALTEIAEKSASERVKAGAKQTLAANFPAPPAPAPDKKKPAPKK